MFCITPTNKIIITRGDNAEIDVRLYDKDGSEVEILPSDIITFTLKKDVDGSIIFNRVAYINSILIEPDDTKELDCGVYLYQVDLERDNEIQTILPMNFFEIKEELR